LTGPPWRDIKKSLTFRYLLLDIGHWLLMLLKSGLGQGLTGYTGYFFTLYACPVEGGDERQKSVIPPRGRELLEIKRLPRSLRSLAMTRENCSIVSILVVADFLYDNQI